MTPTIFYHKNFNSPHCGLHIINPNFGWVEHLQQNSVQVYYASGIPEKLYHSWQQESYKNLKSFFENHIEKKIGLLKNLCQLRLESRFSMPIFATGNQSSITCGSTRFITDVIHKTPCNQIPAIFTLASGETLPPSVEAELVKTTEHFDQLAGLTDTEYDIFFNSATGNTVSTSLVDSKSYGPNNNEQFDNLGKSVLDFWAKFTKNHKINITVHCCRDVNIKYDVNFWNVEQLALDAGTVGYGIIMEKFAKNEDQKLHLYYYGSDTLILEDLLPWPDNRGACWWHTKNKQLHLFETTAGPQSVHRSIAVMANIVK